MTPGWGDRDLGWGSVFAAWFKSVTLQVALWTQAYSPRFVVRLGEISSERTIRTHPPDGTLAVVHQ